MGIFVILGIGIFAFAFRFLWQKGEISVELNRDNYRVGDKMRVTIENNFFNKEVCLSSCYPYFLQKRDGGWEEFSYEKCSYRDKVIKCITPGAERVFETRVPKVFDGFYRLSVPVCEGCNLGTVFREDARFYSDLFKVR